MAIILDSSAPVGKSGRNEEGSMEDRPVMQEKSQERMLSQKLSVLSMLINLV